MSVVLPLPTRAQRPPASASPRRTVSDFATDGPGNELLRVAVAACRELFAADAAELLSFDRTVASSSTGSSRARRETARVVYCAPLVIAGEPVGVMKLTNPGGGRALCDSDLLLFNGILRDLATALEAARVPVSSDSSANVFRREGDFWTIAHAGILARVRDAKGMRFLAQLLEIPGRELHSLELSSGPTPTATAARDVLLDAKSRGEYRARLEELEAEIEEAREAHDSGRVERAQNESEFLLAELRHCVGLAGRPRNAASSAERARQNVTRAIRAAIRHLASHNSALARHLERTIRTGAFCSYAPDPRAPIAWEL